MMTLLRVKQLIFRSILEPKESCSRPEPSGSFIFSVLLLYQELVFCTHFLTAHLVGVSALIKIRCFQIRRTKSEQFSPLKLLLLDADLTPRHKSPHGVVEHVYYL